MWGVQIFFFARESRFVPLTFKIVAPPLTAGRWLSLPSVVFAAFVKYTIHTLIFTHGPLLSTFYRCNSEITLNAFQAAQQRPAGGLPLPSDSRQSRSSADDGPPNFTSSINQYS